MESQRTIGRTDVGAEVKMVNRINLNRDARFTSNPSLSFFVASYKTSFFPIPRKSLTFRIPLENPQIVRK